MHRVWIHLVKWPNKTHLNMISLQSFIVHIYIQHSSYSMHIVMQYMHRYAVKTMALR